MVMFNWFEIINIKSILILQIIVLCLLPRLIEFFFVLKKGFFNDPFETETFKNKSTVWIEKRGQIYSR